MEYTKINGKLSRNNNTKRFYGRFRIRGRRTWRVLSARTAREAKAEIARKQADHYCALEGRCADPFAERSRLTVAGLMDLWRDAGYPDRRLRRQPRFDTVTHRQTQLRHLREFWGVYELPVGPVDPPTGMGLHVSLCDKYHAWRTGRIRRGRGGHRTVELELVLLRNILHWGTRSALIRYSPLHGGGGGRYVDPDTVRNANETMPESDEEFHLIARQLLDEPRSAVLGWQWLLQGLTGCRASEILRLRWDAAKRHTGKRHAIADPGYIDDTCLYVIRSKKGAAPFVLLDVTPGLSPLRDCLRALRAWHQASWPGSPWFLPGRAGDKPPDTTALTHALYRVCDRLKLPHRASHGLRAYHVRALRSLDIGDSEISKRLGHISGVRLVENTYGTPEPGWAGSHAMDFLPDPNEEGSIEPAWAPWLKQAEKNNIIPMAL